MLKKSRAHLDEVKETYFQHMGFALGTAWSMISGGVLLVLHALCPAFFQRSASTRILSLAMKIRARRHKSAPE